MHVTTSVDDEYFPVKRRLLRPCIALTSVVQAGKGKYKSEGVGGADAEAMAAEYHTMSGIFSVRIFFGHHLNQELLDRPLKKRELSLIVLHNELFDTGDSRKQKVFTPDCSQYSQHQPGNNP